MTFRTTFRDIRSSRQIALIDLPCPKNARRIFAIVSTISIPTSAPIIMEASVDPQPPGSRLDADHPENGVLIPRRNTTMVRSARTDAENLANHGPEPHGARDPRRPMNAVFRPQVSSYHRGGRPAWDRRRDRLLHVDGASWKEPGRDCRRFTHRCCCRFHIHGDGRGGAARYGRAARAYGGIFVIRAMDRLVHHSVFDHRRFLASGGLDADAHARPGGAGGKGWVAAPSDLLQALLALVCLRIPGFCRSHCDLLAHDR